MFDNILVKKELPLNDDLKTLKINWKEHYFQTKDLENCLLNYFVSEEGDLYEEIVERDYIPFTEEEKSLKEGYQIWKDVVVKNKYNKKVDFHGTVVFYDIFEFDEKQDIWVDFKA